MNPDEDHKGFVKGKFGELAYTVFSVYLENVPLNTVFFQMMKIVLSKAFRGELFQNSNYHHVMDIF